MKTLERMLTYVGAPITAYVAVGVEAPEWPKGLIQSVPFAPETNGAEPVITVVPASAPVGIAVPTGADRVMVPLTEPELAMLPPELLAKILHGLLRQ